MANKIDWEYIFPVVKIPFKPDCEFQIKAIADKTLKNRSKLLDVGLKPAS